jgi:hypothetical protein
MLYPMYVYNSFLVLISHVSSVQMRMDYASLLQSKVDNCFTSHVTVMLQLEQVYSERQKTC